MPLKLTFPERGDGPAFGMLLISPTNGESSMTAASGTVEIPDGAKVTLSCGLPPGVKVQMADGRPAPELPAADLNVIGNHPAHAYDALQLHSPRTDSLHVIGRFSSLRELVLSGDCVGADAIDIVCGLSSLGALALMGPVTDSDVDRLRALQLGDFHLASELVTPAVLGALVKMSSLTSLTLQLPWITDAHVSRLARLESLTTLHLVGTQVTAQVGDAVSGLTHLRHFAVSPPVFGPNERLRLMLALPGITVDGEYFSRRAAAKLAVARGIEVSA